MFWPDEQLTFYLSVELKTSSEDSRGGPSEDLLSFLSHLQARLDDLEVMKYLRLTLSIDRSRWTPVTSPRCPHPLPTLPPRHLLLVLQLPSLPTSHQLQDSRPPPPLRGPIPLWPLSRRDQPHSARQARRTRRRRWGWRRGDTRTPTRAFRSRAASGRRTEAGRRSCLDGERAAGSPYGRWKRRSVSPLAPRCT